MKVLFAVGGEQLSKNIADKYYEKYGETLEYKNVFYFKALIDEVKKNKTYDRIVINEDFEQYRTNDIEQLDAQLFKNIDRITDEIQDADIILICANRRTKGDPFISKLFSIGIYNLLIGDDRNISPLCDIIKKPKTKKEAKQYLNIDTSIIGDNSMAREDEVDEFQIRSILNYFEGIKNQPEKYVETIDRVAEQYSRTQLKIIISILPNDVKNEILKVDRYKFLMQSDEQPKAPVQQAPVNNVQKVKKPSGGIFGAFKKHKIDEKQNVGTVNINDNASRDNQSINIGSSMLEKNRLEAQRREEAELKAREEAANKAAQAAKAREEALAKKQEELAAKARAEAEAREQAELEAKAKAEVQAREQAELMAKAKAEAEAREQEKLVAQAKAEAEAREQEKLVAQAKAEAEAREQEKLVAQAKAEAEAREQEELAAKARAEAEAKKQAELAAKAKIEAENRARANMAAQTSNVVNDSGIIVEVKPNINAPERNNVESLSGLSAQQKVEVKPMSDNAMSEQERKLKEQQEQIAMEQRKIKEDLEKIEEAKRKLREEQEELAKQAQMRNADNATRYTNNTDVRQMVPSDFRKMIVFVGANKAGTTFVTNAIAHAAAGQKIRTSILDMTRDKSMFYLYNQNDKGMRKKAAECMQRISEGEDVYLDTNNAYLKVYTTVPGSLSDVRRTYKHKSIIETVKNNCNLTIVDADFSTPIDYFEQAVEVYMVQDLDLLKMPDTTLFLRELKNRGMDMKKVKLIINKYVKTSLSPKQIVQTLSYYSDPNMSFVDELLPGKVEYSIIPYNLNNYAKYIDCVCHGVINYKGYSTDFTQAVDEIVGNIYPKNGGATNAKPARRFFS